LGSHDFASFTSPMRGKSTIRNVYRAEVSREEELVLFDVVADSFLPKQVRNTVGALVRVGLGKLAVEGFEEILRVKKPGLAAPAAPAHGLCLMQANYTEHKFGKRQIYENL
jgi:tRNA pseudouridine38-40 synthase